MAKRGDWAVGIIIGISFLLVGALFLLMVIGLAGQKGNLNLPSWGKKIALVEVNGVINDPQPIVKQIRFYRKDDSVLGMVLRVNSPGGGVAAAQEIYEELQKFRRTGKGLVASFGSLAASGGYYIACATDSIVANPGSITGSIGVIYEFPNAQELLKKIGLRFEVVKSGKYKDIGSPSRKLTSEERRLLQSVIDDAYNQFIGAICQGRNLNEAVVRRIADGRIFTGNQAKKIGLVDHLGDYHDAILMAAKMCGIRGEPKTIKLRRRKPNILDFLFGKLKLWGPEGGYRTAGLQYRFQ